MAVTFVQGRTNSAATGAVASVTLSAAPTAGNLLVMLITHANSTPRPAPPTGWDVGSTTATGGGSPKSGLLTWKAAGAGESATITCATTMSPPWCVTVVEYAGVNTSAPVAAPLSGAQSAATAYVTPAITPTAVAGVAVLLVHGATTASATAWSAHQWAASATGVTARVNAAVNNQAGTSGYGTAWDFIGNLAAASTTGTATSPVSQLGSTGAVAFAASAGGVALGIPDLVMARYGR